MMNLLKNILLIFLIVNQCNCLKTLTEGKSMTELESNLGSVAALTNKLALNMDLQGKISTETLNMNEQKSKIRSALKYKDTYIEDDPVLTTFNGLVIIQGKVTLNVMSGYEYANKADQDLDTL